MNNYVVQLHATTDPQIKKTREVSIDAALPLEQNESVAGGIAVSELWAEDGVLYAVDSVKAS